MSKTRLSGICLFALGLSLFAQDTPPAPAGGAPAAPAAPAGPMPLSTPAITGPLSNLPPAMFHAGPFGDIAVNGVFTGMGLVQSNHIPGDDNKQGALSNGQVFIQKSDGWFQFFLE